MATDKKILKDLDTLSKEGKDDYFYSRRKGKSHEASMKYAKIKSLQRIKHYHFMERGTND